MIGRTNIPIINVANGTGNSNLDFIKSQDLILYYVLMRNYVESEYTADQENLIKRYLTANLDNGGSVIV